MSRHQWSRTDPKKRALCIVCGLQRVIIEGERSSTRGRVLTWRRSIAVRYCVPGKPESEAVRKMPSCRDVAAGRA